MEFSPPSSWACLQSFYFSHDVEFLAFLAQVRRIKRKHYGVISGKKVTKRNDNFLVWLHRSGNVTIMLKITMKLIFKITEDILQKVKKWWHSNTAQIEKDTFEHAIYELWHYKRLCNIIRICPTTFKGSKVWKTIYHKYTYQIHVWIKTFLECYL